MAQTQARNDFSQGSISRNIISLALPMTAAQLVNVLYSVVDRIYLGRLPGHLALTGLGLTLPIISIVMGFANLCGTGGAPLCSIYRGKGEEEEAERIMGNAFTLLLIFGAAVTGVFLLFRHPLLYLFGASDATYPYAEAYMTIYLLGTVFVMIGLGMNPFITSQGFGRTGMMTVGLGAVVNIVLDPVFIFALDMGVRGAALATVIAQAVSVGFSAFYIRKKGLPFHVSRESFRIAGTVRRIARVGAPIAAQDFLVSISFLIITGIVNSLGLVASAGIGVSEKLYVFLSIVPMAFMSALSAFVAQNVGAGNLHRATRALWMAQGISLLFGILMFLLTFFQGGLLASAFEKNPEVLAATAEYLRGSSFEYLLISLSFCMLGYFNGRGRTGFVMLQGLFTAFLIRVPLSYFLSRLPQTGMFQISLAVPASALVSLLLCISYFWWIRRQDRRQN